MLLDTEDRVSLFSVQRKQALSLYRGESGSLLDREEADFFSIQKRGCLSSLERSVCVCTSPFIGRRDILLLILEKNRHVAVLLKR